MADVCTGPQGEDLCHLARGPPAVDFTTIRQKRREKRSHDDTKQAATQDPRIAMALEAGSTGATAAAAATGGGGLSAEGSHTHTALCVCTVSTAMPYTDS